MYAQSMCTDVILLAVCVIGRSDLYLWQTTMQPLLANDLSNKYGNPPVETWKVNICLGNKGS